MPIFTRFLLIFLLGSILSSCGGGGSYSASGGSGIGGTGVTFVRGNISSIDSQSVALTESRTQYLVVKATQIEILHLALAQSTDLADIVVFGGGKSSSLSRSGTFELANVEPSTQFTLTFRLSTGDELPLHVGVVPLGTTVVVNDISLNTNTGTAQSASINVAVSNGTNGISQTISGEGSTSEDSASEDDTSEDNVSEDSISEDDISEDSISEDDVSEDSISEDNGT